MATIEEYLEDPLSARIDALSDPVLRHFIDLQDIETVSFSRGGVQYQAQALKLASISTVFQKAVAALAQQGVNLRHLVCSPQEFNFCDALQHSPMAVVLKSLDAFLAKSILGLGVTGIGVAGVFSASAAVATVANFVTLLLALAHIRRALEKMCQCP
ncbi:MAG: hypothetical protein Q8M80_15250 [Hydrogenophaga sp.]|uniref:hypothetical protein n=1 Tax=Hydrogenophaga sp. TaxID=1904254 RepID=UPI0027303060|nr:hypothetical protein [Hydrogenophaga sp.]MDP2250683.1 hypothetical protein [Hydrogenophaga sp.]MDP3205415.1 hypothetical protein [Hydrogenophaga sp.]MDP3625083.1 hypothetical protein [Hydrogenophaga sp.]